MEARDELEEDGVRVGRGRMVDRDVLRLWPRSDRPVFGDDQASDLDEGEER